ncbi:universal stress protein [uncultured Corynebacterium sp.]|uniref:universal stress protein n=1 Tax=uncultured Corynebacterium sp. TaxID=159447 RepID=UPI002624B875|nr:universal stress protein [uncultured Corynebacterium sp.]
MYNTVVVGTDGSESSFLAVRRAAGVAAAMDAELVLASAYVGEHADTATKQTTAVEGEMSAAEVLASARKEAEREGAKKVRAVLKEGDPVEALMSIVKSEEADLLVVGNRGINSLTGRLLGSVPADAARQAECDVMIVHTVGTRD